MFKSYSSPEYFREPEGEFGAKEFAVFIQPRCRDDAAVFARAGNQLQSGGSLMAQHMEKWAQCCPSPRGTQ